jgi:RNA polymerase sigma-70 factor (ECF subfamily)
MRPARTTQEDFATFDDRALISLARQGESGAFRAIMRRNNRRLYRVARSIVRDDTEAEDVLQESYVRAFIAMGEFRSDSSLSTWLTRIVLNEALGRVRKARPTVGLDTLDALGTHEPARVIPFPIAGPGADPERAAARHEISGLFERVIDELPAPFRVVFMMRAVEEMSTEETALALGLRPETVKTRLHRARRLLRKALAAKLASALTDAFPFDGWRCARIGDAVLVRLHSITTPLPEGPGPDNASTDRGGGISS